MLRSTAEAVKGADEFEKFHLILFHRVHNFGAWSLFIVSWLLYSFDSLSLSQGSHLPKTYQSYWTDRQSRSVNVYSHSFDSQSAMILSLA